MSEGLEEQAGSVSIGGRIITNLCFADDIDGLAGDEQEVKLLTRRLNSASAKYGMEINMENTKLMTNNPSGFQEEIEVNSESCNSDQIQISRGDHIRERFKARGSYKDHTDYSSNSKIDTYLKGQEHHP